MTPETSFLHILTLATCCVITTNLNLTHKLKHLSNLIETFHSNYERLMLFTVKNDPLNDEITELLKLLSNEFVVFLKKTIKCLHIILNTQTLLQVVDFKNRPSMIHFLVKLAMNAKKVSHFYSDEEAIRAIDDDRIEKLLISLNKPKMGDESDLFKRDVFEHILLLSKMPFALFEYIDTHWFGVSTKITIPIACILSFPIFIIATAVLMGAEMCKRLVYVNFFGSNRNECELRRLSECLSELRELDGSLAREMNNEEIDFGGVFDLKGLEEFLSIDENQRRVRTMVELVLGQLEEIGDVLRNLEKIDALVAIFDH